jgi:hypothetical protein
MASLKASNITRFEAKRSTEDEWTRRTHEEWDATLFPTAKSWYQGGMSLHPGVSDSVPSKHTATKHMMECKRKEEADW